MRLQNKFAGVANDHHATAGVPEKAIEAIGDAATNPNWDTVASPPGEFPFLDAPQEAGELGWFGHYRVLEVLGQGGMGVVFRAEDPRLQRPVALKVMLPGIAQNDVARQRFLREARATAAIRSDHIVAIYEIGQHEDLPFLVTELLHGEPLDGWLQRTAPATLATVLNFSIQIARGLQAAHSSGLIHRDIKPANIWLEEPTGRIKILDFGLARPVGGDALITQNGSVLGTPAYMAPEQADGKSVDERCDLFSLGCVLYEIAAGQKAFDGPSAITILKAIALNEPPSLHLVSPEIPEEFSILVDQLLAKNPDQRPASAGDVVEVLETIADNVIPPAAARVSSAKLSLSMVRQGLQGSNVTKKPPRRIKRWIIAGVEVALVTVATTVIGWHVLWGGSLGDGMWNGAPSSETNNAQAGPGSNAPAAAVPGVTDQEILLGLSAPFSGTSKELGRGMEVGIQTYFRHINAEGGIAGRKLKLIALDDGYDPERALTNMKELYEKHRIFATIGNVGTPTAEATLPYALSRKTLFFGAFTGAPFLRKDPPDRYVFNYRASYEEETAAIVKYLVESRGFRPEQIAVFAQRDAYGDSGYKGVVKTLRKFERKPEEILRVGHQRNSIDVSAAVQEILRHKDVKVVVMVSTYRPAAAFIRQLKDAKRNLLFTNVSFVGSDALADELLPLGRTYFEDVIVTQVVPHPASHASVVLKYREHLARYQPNEVPSFVSLEGYINAAILVEGLRRAGINLTTETLVEALETIRGLDLGFGMPINFGPSDHQASSRVWGTVLDASGNYQMLDLE